METKQNESETIQTIDREVIGNSIELGNGVIRLTSSTADIKELSRIALYLHTATVNLKGRPPSYTQ